MLRDLEGSVRGMSVEEAEGVERERVRKEEEWYLSRSEEEERERERWVSLVVEVMGMERGEVVVLLEVGWSAWVEKVVVVEEVGREEEEVVVEVGREEEEEE